VLDGVIGSFFTATSTRGSTILTMQLATSVA
jgi:hypothetical protein